MNYIFAQLTFCVYYLFICHFIFVCNIVNHIKCIVWEINKQYQTELPLVLYSTGSSLKIGFRPGSIKWVKTLLTNSSRIITCVVFLQFRRKEDGRRRSTQRTRGKEVDGQTYTINSQQTEPKFCKNHLRNEAYSRRNRSSLRNQDIIIKTSNYLTSSIITHNNLNHTHKNTYITLLHCST